MHSQVSLQSHAAIVGLVLVLLGDLLNVPTEGFALEGIRDWHVTWENDKRASS